MNPDTTDDGPGRRVPDRTDLPSRRRSLTRSAIATLLLVGLLATGATVPAGATAADTTLSATMHDSGSDGPGGHGPPGAVAWPVMFLMPVAFLGLLAGLGYLVYRAIDRQSDRRRPREVLDAAYATGDVSEEEYERRRDRIES